MNRATKLLFDNIHWPILLGIVVLGVWLRSIGWEPGEILDFDPWWFFRHAQEILANDFLPPKWDILSYYPPGRPVDYYLGWSYTLAIGYAIVSNFMEITMEEFAGIFVAIFASLSAIPAYFVGKQATNRWGGLAVAFFSIVTVTFISVSIAGYTDSDGVDVFYSFLAVAATFYAVKKADIIEFSNVRSFLVSLAKFMPHFAPAMISFWLFALNWSSSWYIFYVFLLFVPVLVGMRMVERMFREGKLNTAFLGLVGATFLVYGSIFTVALIDSQPVAGPAITSVLIILGLVLLMVAYIRKARWSDSIATLKEVMRQNKNIIFTVLLIGFLGQVITTFTAGWPFNTIPPHDQLIQGLNLLGATPYTVATLAFTMGIIGVISSMSFGGRLVHHVAGLLIGIVIIVVLLLLGITGVSLIVFQSVAELQPVENFSTIIARIGAVPIYLSFLALGLTAIKLVLKTRIRNEEYFTIVWLMFTIAMIFTGGIRFSLLLSMSAAAAAGMSIGTLIAFGKKSRNGVVLGTFFAIFLLAGTMHLSDNYAFSQGIGGGVAVSDNFKAGFNWLQENVDENSLITTWWDPGHIIAGMTGLKVHADGAHCGPDSCAFLDHNSRIQDMGRAFAVSDEDESARVLSRYMSITPEQCQELEEKFPTQFDPASCEPVSDMYVLATSDLIGKYYWLSFFGTQEGAVFSQCGINQGETQRLGAPTYTCSAAVPMQISIVQNEQGFLAVMNSPAQGVRNAPIRDIVLFQNGQQFSFRMSENTTGVIDGMIWFDPSFGSAIFMQPKVRDSVFTNMFFFDGRGNPDLGIPPLERYTQVYANPEMKIYRVNFEGLTTEQSQTGLQDVGSQIPAVQLGETVQDEPATADHSGEMTN